MKIKMVEGLTEVRYFTDDGMVYRFNFDSYIEINGIECIATTKMINMGGHGDSSVLVSHVWIDRNTGKKVTGKIKDKWCDMPDKFLENFTKIRSNQEDFF